jgi:hypothetical protein
MASVPQQPREPATSVHCVFRDGFGEGPVTGVQDKFGKQFHYARWLHAAGDVLSVPVMQTDGRIVPSNFRIVSRVHPNSIHAVLRRAGKRGVELAAGCWFEVHGD